MRKGLAVASCGLLSGLYVTSLYVWTLKRGAKLRHRDEPIEILQRFASVFFVCIASVAYVQIILISGTELSLAHCLGFRKENLFSAIVVPMLPLLSLFLGPIVMSSIDWVNYASSLGFFSTTTKHVRTMATDLLTMRNLVVGPVSEELVFRACMALFLSSARFSHTHVVLISLFFFGIAHLHHVIQHVHKGGRTLREGWLEVLFQLVYTSLFGAYAMHLFLATGHFIAPLLAHVFCNFMGLPEFHRIPGHMYKRLVSACLFIGIILFGLLLGPCTNPALFDSMYQSTE
mmetsp:Transcript_13758/g.22721  ORF Transcript_13758/g.22721 Transcript_13758/m.22721 type:complete len:288 (-) Transcript_13758:374-1237(-)